MTKGAAEPGPSGSKGLAPKRLGPRRLGPRPLPLHLTNAIGVWTSSKIASQLLSSGSIAWRPDLKDQAEDLTRSLSRLEPAILQAALDREIERRVDSFTQGLLAYRRHPHRRELPEPVCVAQFGTTRVLQYPASDGPARPPLLLVPSLINRSYILDLAPDRSFVRWLAEQGFDVLLVDWGRPGDAEQRFSLDNYVLDRLEPIAAQAAAKPGQRPILIGYCMGGLLALALALRRPDLFAGLALMATPWDFHSQDGNEADRPEYAPIVRNRMSALVNWLEPVMAAAGVLPVDVIQALFASRDPLGTVRKFSVFAKMPPDSSRARAFVELEDWLNDGVPLATPVARECLIGWYGENRPYRNRWTVAGDTVSPSSLDLPLLCLIPSQDRIVSPAGAAALARCVPGCAQLNPPAGHIGMMASREAPRAVWQPLVDWVLVQSQTA